MSFLDLVVSLLVFVVELLQYHYESQDDDCIISWPIGQAQPFGTGVLSPVPPSIIESSPTPS
jgi:hypothetical protein